MYAATAADIAVALARAKWKKDSTSGEGHDPSFQAQARCEFASGVCISRDRYVDSQTQRESEREIDG